MGKRSKVDPLDPQRERLYAFEDRWPWAWQNNCTLAQCREAIRSACEHYEVPPPTVIQHKRRSLSWCDQVNRRISLQAVGPNNRGGKNIATALHEAAHQIVYDLCPDNTQDHGPVFCGIYFLLLWEAGWPIEAIRAVARKHRVRWVLRPPSWFGRGPEAGRLGKARVPRRDER